MSDSIFAVLNNQAELSHNFTLGHFDLILSESGVYNKTRYFQLQSVLKEYYLRNATTSFPHPQRIKIFPVQYQRIRSCVNP